MLLGKSLAPGTSITDVPKPTISSNELLIKVHATALNPIDFKFVDFIAPSGSKLGCDFAGEIAEVGNAASSSWKVGDRVAGFVQGGVSPEYGAFAEYVKAESDLVWKVPQEINDETAATFGVPACTAMQALSRHLGVPFPDEVMDGKRDTGSPILIYAGSTAVGLFAIQLAKAAGCTVVTTCSPHSNGLVKSFGADAIFNYRSPTAVQDIKKAYPDIARALDCISEGKSTDFAARALGSRGGKVVTLLDSKAKVPGVEVKMIMSFQMLGKAFAWLPPVGPKYEVSSEDRAALARFYATLERLAPNMKVPPVKSVPGNFQGILDGLDTYRAGKVSGSKLVVRL